MNRIGGIILGLLLAIVGLVSAGFGLFYAFGEGKPEDRFLAGATAIPYGILLLELGLAAIWLTVRTPRGEGDRAVTLPPWWASALVFAVAIIGGVLALKFDQWWLFFPLTTVAVFAPIVAAGRLGLPWVGWRPSWGRLLAAFAWGAVVAPILALAGQLVAIVGVAFAAIFGLSLGSEGSFQRILDTWRYYLQGRSLSGAQETALLQYVLRQPLVLVAGASILVVAAPATEELCKFAAVPLFARTRSRPGGPAADPTLTIFLLGLASGLGFAATENIFYVGGASETGWLPMAIVRGLTPMMHGTSTALFALGYARQIQHPRSWSLLWGALAALGLHGAWNLCTGLLLVASAFTTGPNAPTGLATLLLLLSLVVLGGLLLLCVGILLRQRRSLAIVTAQGTFPPDGPGIPAPPAPAMPGPFVPRPPPPPFTGPLPGRGEPVRAGSE
jgi:RsiW-degrading membrane proteinase PrsW (M82 family)